MKWCPDMLPYWDSDMVNYDGNSDIWHASIKEFLTEDKISWNKLQRHFGIKIEE